MTFVKGQSGNPAGRVPGSKNKISEKFIEAITSDFEANGVGVIEKVRTDKPEAYLKIVADLVPKDFNLGQDKPFKMVFEWTTAEPPKE
jgi:hypothetical protein